MSESEKVFRQGRRRKLTMRKRVRESEKACVCSKRRGDERRGRT